MLDVIEEQSSGRERNASDEEQAYAEVAIYAVKVEGPLDIASAQAPDSESEASAEEESMLQDTDADRELALVLAATEVHFSISIVC